MEPSDARSGKGLVVVAAACIVLIGCLLLGGCLLIDHHSSSRTVAPMHTKHVRLVYIVESSWFGTTPKIVSANLGVIRDHMAECAKQSVLRCEVMMFAAEGGELADKRVPKSLQEDPDTGYWYGLTTKISSQYPAAQAIAIDGRIREFIAQVKKEVVASSYAQQVHGCVDLLDNLAAALREIKRDPGDRNVIEIFATGLSNCHGQPYYPGHAFPTVGQATANILRIVPAGSARIDTRRSICIEWTPMFGQGVLAKNIYIGPGQRQILEQGWQNVMEKWGAIEGNRPGETYGDCLSTKDGSR